MDKNNLKNKKQEGYLKQQIESGDFVGFMLFVGQKGTGKYKAVEDFATSVLCESGNGEPCLMCSSCKLATGGNHPDFLKLGGEGTIKIAEIRKLQKSLYLKPYQASHKVAIIEDAHLMTEESANAMLKVLEEPPENSIIILTSPDKKLLPETIVSRSQIVSFGTGGILQKTEDSEAIHGDVMNILGKIPVYEKMIAVQKYSKEKPLLLDFLNTLEGVLREAILGSNNLINFSEKKVINILELTQKSREYLKNNLSSKFVLENLILNIG
jgi:DNA polymerase III delta prime subunit